MSDTDATLVRMANQIADFFASQRHETGALGVADHIAAFWDPAMRRRLLTLDQQDAGQLHPLVHAAVTALRDGSPRSIEADLAAQQGVPMIASKGSDAG